MKKIYAAVVAFLIVLSCSGCYDGFAVSERYPYYQSDCWYCKEIDFAINFEYNEDGYLKPVSYPLEKDGEVWYVIVDFIIDSWYFDLDNGDGLVSTEEQLMSGTWMYRNGDLVLLIAEDKLFDSKYHELVFVSR